MKAAFGSGCFWCSEAVMFLSNGFYRFNGKWKNREIGYDKERKVEIEHLYTKVDADGQPYILVQTTRTMHIKSGILFNKIGLVGKIEQYSKKISLNSDKKRFWLRELKSLSDGAICDSLPINANLVANLISNQEAITWPEDAEEKYHPESEL